MGGPPDSLASVAAPRALARDARPTDDNGAFELPARGPTSTFFLRLQRSDGSTQWLQEVRVLPGVTLDLGDLVLRAPQRVTGFVRDTQGRPVAGAEVLCADAPVFVQAFLQSCGAPVAAGILPGPTRPAAARRDPRRPARRG
ncbi:MAG TPA: hypothetical protein VFY71_17685 [Planctomycetota bacterium]|nr:hypothetical protein [Planctomycetota bacterium]